MIIPHCTDTSDDLGNDKAKLIVVIVIPIVIVLFILIIIAIVSTLTAYHYYKCKRNRLQNDMVSSILYIALKIIMITVLFN